MIKKQLSKFSILLVLPLLACRQGRSSGCSSTQAQVSDSDRLFNSPMRTPAGGYIHFGPRTCTVMLLLERSDERALYINAFTANHCSREDLPEHPRVSLSLFIPGTSDRKANFSNKAFYLKDVTVRDGFFERRKNFLSEIEKLGDPVVLKLAQMATKIPFDLGTQTNTDAKPADEAFSAVEKYCIDKAKPRVKGDNYLETCWSTADSGYRELTILASDVGEKNFALIKSYLEEKRAEHDKSLIRSKSLATQYNAWIDRKRRLIGLNRFDKYAQLALSLNKEFCTNSDKKDSLAVVCKFRSQIEAAADKFLIETDIDGKQKSIIFKLDELGVGSGSAFNRSKQASSVDGQSQSVRSDIREIFKAEVSDKIMPLLSEVNKELEKNFVITNAELKKIGGQFTILANLGFNSEGERRLIFGQLKLSSFFAMPYDLKVQSTLPADSSGTGAFKIYFNKNDARLKFSKTDSGSIIVNAEIMPVVVLHAVDREPLSGGASILALPEAPTEESSVREKLPQAQPQDKATPIAGRENMPDPPARESVRQTTTQIGTELNDADLLVSANEPSTSCY